MALHGITILEVDDCEAHNYALSRMLEVAGCTVLRAKTGTEALVLASQRPDAVLLDVQLPDIDGYEVCRRLKRNPDTAKIPVVFLTANCQDAFSKAMAESVGGNELLFYPIENRQLLAILTSQIVRARAEGGSWI